jgi:hypothetical protein
MGGGLLLNVFNVAPNRRISRQILPTRIIALRTNIIGRHHQNLIALASLAVLPYHARAQLRGVSFTSKRVINPKMQREYAKDLAPRTCRTVDYRAKSQE